MRLDLLLWLAESNRDFNLAGPGLAAAAAGKQHDPPSWLHDVTFDDTSLPYEPRCLARSPNGKLLAVGTKAGVLRVARQDPNGWTHLEITPAAAAATTRRSIRAVRFLDDKTIVAGWGEGIFGVFAPLQDRLICTHQTQAQPQPASGESIATRDRRWLDRFARIVSLVPPGPPGTSIEPGRAVMLGLTLGSGVHLLTATADGFEASTTTPEEVFREIHKGARITDGVWSDQGLWLLDSAGRIYCYRRGDPPAANPRTRLQAVDMDRATLSSARRSDQASKFIKLTSPRVSGDFRAIASCVMGLAVLASDHVTFLRFSTQDGVYEPRLDLRSPRWVEVPRAIDCSVCLPFSSYYHPAALASQEIQEKNPVWTVVSTAQPGLRWIGWHDEGTAQGVMEARPLAHRTADSSVLQVRFGFENREGPTYIACATRNHHLRIATVLDRKRTAEQLDKEIPHALQTRPGEPRLENHRGIAWWQAWRQVHDDFASPAPRVLEDDERRRLLRLADRVDLFRLVRWVIEQWKRSTLGATAKRDLLRAWIRQILARAYHIDETLAMELAKAAHDRIVRLASGDAEGRDLEIHLLPFAAFLRKWVIFGHTYGEKAEGLLQLFDWNEASGHHLDGLAYLTKLLRQRVDPVWEARPQEGPPGVGIWDLVAPPGGEFSIHSCTDGGIVAVDAGGGSLEWLPGAAAPDVTELEIRHQLQIWQGRLRHRLAEEFLSKYRHGPSARSLALSATGTGGGSPHLLLFCTRGFRPDDKSEFDAGARDARLFALLAEPAEGKMRILSIASQTVPADLYGLCELRHLSERGRRHVFLAGTKGAWQSGKSWKARPFIELTVELRPGGMSLNIQLNDQVEVVSDPRGVRSAFNQDDVRPEAAHNPCWSLAVYKSREGEHWLWAGFHDGRIRCFLRQPGRHGSGCWTEGGAREDQRMDEEARFLHRVQGFAASASLWRLHVLQEQGILAYGTSDGVIGAFPLEAPLAAESATTVSNSPSAATDSATERPHLAHYRESSPICGLLSYREPDGGTRLLALTQGGVIVLMDFDPADRLSAEVSRFQFPGLRLDRFALGHEARAAAIVPHTEEPHRRRLSKTLPAVLVGSKEGGVFKHVLALPRSSERRRVAFNTWCDQLFAAGGIGDFVGKETYSWLRLLDVRGVHLLRFSIAHDLRHGWPVDEPARLAKPEELKRYIAHLNELADDVYGRQPLTPEPAKIIWEEAARAANLMARRALSLEKHQQDAERETLINGFLALNKVVDDLCNRWSGSEQSVESRVLMYTFNCLFGWAGVVIIGMAQPSAAGLAARRFLLHNLIH